MSDLSYYLRNWNQDFFPYQNEILVDDLYAVMSQRSFDKAPEYSCTTPTGVYPGKRWKAQCPQTGTWFLREYTDGGVKFPDKCGMHTREILVVK